MRGIKLVGVSKRYNGESILDGINLEIPPGTFFALLGPSGSGKTTLLRLIAGFETVDAGTIFLGDEDITYTPIYQRRINTVFQHYALFPHLNVFDNVAYSLSIRKVPKDIIEQKVIKMLKTVHLEKHIYKPIQQLSGGQQQRVALIRAVINEPEVLLLDEPLAALDLGLREKMLVELVDLQSKLKTTFIYVTHDQLEALTVADKMVIMNYDGEIEQIGTPKEVYEFPASSFVATFVGTSNVFKGKLILDGARAAVEIADVGIFDVVLPKESSWIVSGMELLMSIRPEKIEISKKKLEGFANSVAGKVLSIVYNGRSTQYHVQLPNGTMVTVFEQNEEHFPQDTIDYNDEALLYWQKEKVVLLKK